MSSFSAAAPSWFRQISDDEATDLEVLWRLADRLPNTSHRLAEWAAGLSERLVRKHRELAAARPGAFLPNLATSLNNQANRLGELGRHEEALEASTEAAAVYRELAAARPAVHQLEYEQSLRVLAWLRGRRAAR